MIQQAYITLTEDHHWALIAGNGSRDDAALLAVGRPFHAGADILEAVAELEAWAADNQIELTTPEYVLNDWSLADLIEPEVFDDVFGAPDEQDEA